MVYRTLSMHLFLGDCEELLTMANHCSIDKCITVGESVSRTIGTTIPSHYSCHFQMTGIAGNCNKIQGWIDSTMHCGFLWSGSTMPVGAPCTASTPTSNVSVHTTCPSKISSSLPTRTYTKRQPESTWTRWSIQSLAVFSHRPSHACSLLETHPCSLSSWSPFSYSFILSCCIRQVRMTNACSTTISQLALSYSQRWWWMAGWGLPKSSLAQPP